MLVICVIVVVSWVGLNLAFEFVGGGNVERARLMENIVQHSVFLPGSIVVAPVCNLRESTTASLLQLAVVAIPWNWTLRVVDRVMHAHGWVDSRLGRFLVDGRSVLVFPTAGSPEADAKFKRELDKLNHHIS